MPIGGQPIDKKREAGIIFQVGRQGVSADFRNNLSSVNCKQLLNMPGFELASSGFSAEELRKNILNKVKDFSSYTEYMEKSKEVDGFKLQDYLTERGLEIVKRLDEIALELRSLYVDNPQNLNVNRILELLEEGRKIITEQ